MNYVVVDDDIANLDLFPLLMTLADESYRCIGKAASYEDGARLILETNPQIVFLDMKIGNRTGVELLEGFNEIDFQVVFVTGYDEELIQTSINDIVPSYEVIVKPYGVEQLKAISNLFCP